IIPHDVSVKALSNLLSSELFNRTQNAVYNGITSYADQLRRQDIQRQKEQKQQQNNNANSNNQDIKEMKSMMRDMIDIMSNMLQSSNNIENSNQTIANKNINLDGKEITNNVNTKMGHQQQMSYYMQGLNLT